VLLFLKDRTALYDIEAKKLLPVEGSLVTIGSSPSRPDGKGFLTLSKERLHFVSWDGKGRAIKGPLEEELRDDPETDPPKTEGLLLYPSRWEGAVAILDIHLEAEGQRWRIDTGKLEATEREHRFPGLKDGDFIKNSYSFPKGATVQVVAKQDPPGEDLRLR